jgi:plastocyanin
LNIDVDDEGLARSTKQTPRGIGWRRLQVAAAVGVVASLLVPMLMALSLEPFLLAMAAPFMIGLLVMIRWPRVGAFLLGFFSLAVLLFSVPFLAEALIHPESSADFIPLVVFALGAVVGVIAAIPSLRQGRRLDRGSRSARTIAVVAGVILFASLVLSIVAFTRIESVPARAGDITVITEDVEFHPAEITAREGELSFHITNRDDIRHTFTIDELGVDLNIPPNSSQRVSFSAGPGTFEFYCRPHVPGMEGLLVAE